MKRMISIGEAEKLAKEYAYEENEEALYELVQEILSQEKVIGSIDDFHNFAVNFSRKDDYETACNILDKGLDQFPKAVDLLADYLQNGVNCNRFKQCEECFDMLLKIPMMRWTWRGFSFSIDYMQSLADNIEEEDELIEWKQKMLDMADNYYKFYAYSEDTFLAKADIFQYFNDREKEIEILFGRASEVLTVTDVSMVLYKLKKKLIKVICIIYPGYVKPLESTNYPRMKMKN